jgi:hypothetical protein
MATANRSQIETHLQRLTEAFKPHLHGLDCIDVDEEFRENWHRRIAGSDVEFHCWSQPLYRAWRSGNRSTCPVVRAVRFKEQWAGQFIWIGWREKWRKQKTGHSFDLLDASMTIFAAPYTYGRPLDGQLFRVEWTQEGFGSKTAAHPHWQVDSSLKGSGIDISGVHFGMAGWDCGGRTTPPQCWQRFVGTGVASLELWAESTLVYCIDQLYDHVDLSAPFGNSESGRTERGVGLSPDAAAGESPAKGVAMPAPVNQ